MQKLQWLLLGLTILIANLGLAIKEKEWKVKNVQGVLYGTFCWQPKKEIKAVALIIAGSGPTDRNGNSGFTQNNALRFLAHDLAKKGIATLRYDKQGVGKSAGAAKSEQDLRFNDFVDDAILWLEALNKKHKKKKKLIIGHSEGALIAKLAASKLDVAGVISISGAGRRISNVLKEQLAETLKEDKELLSFANMTIDSLEAGKKVNKIDPSLISLFRPSVQPYLISWMKHNPLQVLQSLKNKNLIIQGTTDLQTSVADAEILAKSQNSKVEIIDNMNHVLKEIGDDNEANQMSYLNPDLPLHPALVPAILKFVNEL